MYQSIYKRLPVFVLLFCLLSGNVLAQSFITTWQIDNPGDQITIPTTGSGYNYDIDWGDTSTDNGVTGNITHIYSAAGIYTVSITGDFPRIYFNGFSSPSRNQILTVQQWGSNVWTSMNSAFQGCSNLVINATDVPNLTNVTDMTEMFRGATSLNQDISGWNVSNVTNMTSTFSGASSFNQSLDSWDVSSVTDMTSMFASAIVFDGQIGAWDVSNVTEMDRMFETARDFNQNIGGWDVSQVIDMTRMFRSANSFNQDIGGWNVGNVANMELMFSFASVFNQDIGGWNVGSVTDMSNMFSPASVFNQNIDAWDVSSVTTMQSMFDGARDFNQPLNSWDVSSVTTMRSMFLNADVFNQDLNSWVVSAVTDMRSMFNDARAFNGAIGNWDVSSVTTMNSMFRDASDFNQNINSWNVSSVTNMGDMFGSKGTYDQPLNLWDVSSVTNMNSMFVFTNFNQDISTWNVGSVVDFGSMFGNNSIFNQDISGWDMSSATSTDDMFRSCSVFNQDISGWDVSNVVNMGGMFDRAEVFNQDISGWDVGSVMFTFSTFSGASAFDQDLSSWDISNVINTSNMLDNSGISVENYDNMLVGWSALPSLQPNLTLGAIGLNYCTAETARNNIITTYGWTIVDEGLGCPEGEIATFDGPNNTFPEILDGQPMAIDFGIQAQGTGINRTFVIENQGSAALTIANISSSGSEFILNSPLAFPLVIASGGGQLFDILLTASNPGVFTETITITSDDADEPTFEFQITGDISGTVRYVKRDATGNNDGTSWTDAFTDLQNALAVAINDDLIWIAEGIYKPDLSAPGNTSLTFNIMSDRLRIYGGFLGTESQLSERIGDPTLTVLSGDLNGDDGPAFTNTSDNSENVLTVNGFIVFIDYLTISDGNAPSNGGGILANNAGVYLTNAVLENNQSMFGGGLYHDGGTIQLHKTAVRNNEAGTSGGGAYIINAEPYLFRAIFESNEAFSGAGLYMENANQVNNSTFYYNQFINNGRDYQAVVGGAIYLDDSYYESFGDLFINNFAYDAGGAISARNGSTIRLTNSTFGNNESNDTSADIYFSSSDFLSIYNSILWGGTNTGGATGSLVSINNAGASFEIRNSIVQAWDPSEYSITPVATNVSASNPLFTDAASDDLTISDSSPAINMGDNSYASYLDVGDEDGDMDFSELAPYDLLGNSRYFNSTIDIGAYENQTAAAPEPEIAVFQGVDISSSTDEIFNGQTSSIDLGLSTQGIDIVLPITIANIDAGDLNVFDISISGAGFSTDATTPFTIAGFVDSAIPVVTFNLILSGANSGFFNETITINNDDSDESSFTFPVSGEITLPPAPEIAVFEVSPASEITDGQPTVLSFGTAVQGTDITKQFRIENQGTADLTISDINFSGSAFTLANTAPSSIGAGLSEILDVVLSGASDGFFTETLTILNNDADEGVFDFQVTGEITATNSSPTISPIADASIEEDGSTGNIPFTISDVETNLDDLIVTASSDNAALVSTSGIILTGTGGDRAINITPESNASGSAIITVQVDDGQAVANATFTLSVTPVNDAPIITGQDVFNTPVNTLIDLPLTSFTVTDIDNNYPTGFSLLINEGQNYTASGNTVTPAPDFVGNLTVPIVISDGIDNSPVFNVTISVIEGELAIDFDGQPLANGSIISFDDIPVGAEDNRELVITNTGITTLIISDINIEGEDFRLNSPIPGPILAGANSPLSIIFQPTSIGSKTAILTVRSASAADFTATLTASGLSEAPALEIFNVVSVQQNGKHDFLEIRNIEFYNANRVFIYSRWGNEVFQTNNYDNTANRFSGNSDSGAELPDGTYYYVIELNGGEIVENGFFLLRR